ncbi:BamA/TamA family outer membrane protein [Flavobacterium humi]|uniref:Haemolysin activator HlyB C-terminal domain-containing protein n=1 Tax=Flavobacterium humi TaxID=2562683 RepID=A0A4Z0L3Q5_9FLAO|nr:hypothetical protein [Flavobacterium humi]TGD57082.1 hypothetical protein E4635_13010 [Flavobacterium humi]
MKFLCLLFISIACQCVSAQDLYLRIQSGSEAENKTIDSIGYSKTHTTTKSLLDETNRFSEKLLANGFLEAEHDKAEKINDTTFLFLYRLGPQKKFINIRIGKDFRLLNLEKDSLRLPISETGNFMDSSLQLLEKKGYSLAKLQLVNFKSRDHELFADLNFQAEKIRTLDGIIINGYSKFPASHTKNIQRLYRKKIFNQENLKKLHADFEKFRFASQTKYPEILFSKDSTKVYVYLEKAKPNTFDGFIGFNNDDEKKVVINGYLDLQLQNILNGGEKFNVFWKSDGKNQKTFNGAIEIPYLFQSPLGLKAQLNIFKQDSIFQNTLTGIDLGYYFNYNTRVYLGYQSTESSDIQNSNNSSISDFKNSFLTSHLDFSVYNPDDFLFPDKTLLYFKIGAGNRKSKINGNDQFFAALNASHNFYLNKKNSINITSKNFYLKSDSYIINELHRFGGINSIRGFTENSLQGNVFTSLLTEYRYAATPNMYLHSIIDYGYYQDKTSNTSNSLIGLGFGFGILTKNGLLNLVYANGSAKNQPIKLSNSILHISFRAKFN